LRSLVPRPGPGLRNPAASGITCRSVQRHPFTARRLSDDMLACGHARRCRQRAVRHRWELNRQHADRALICIIEPLHPVPEELPTMDQHPVYGPEVRLTCSPRHRSKRSTPCAMAKPNPPAGSVDIVALVRSLQRSAGMEDCFRMGRTDCTQFDCAWRHHCLGHAPVWEKKQRRVPDRE